jgi:butyrate kinase
MRKPLQLIINPGSTTTKLSVYQDTEELNTCTIDHSSSDLSVFPTISSQKAYRLNLIEEYLGRQNISAHQLDIIMGRGGVLHSLQGGVY